ncbi:nitroreductase/quinone reductase family protein [Actinoplanes sp. RD1]|uniref:nitroreductase/quinone reductase family protein n=1 Tax=Actinoplanes sp. RD1 TaxID=3064538 RepID=UPI0027424D30|nr:nitroreductase/quinone reductase family protein [Actinoplanes sp. RD1]
MANDFNQSIIDEFRAHGGRVGGPFEGGRLLLLTTTGRRTGTRYTTPVAPVTGPDGRTYLIGSAGGSPRHPDWYLNILADPEVTVEDGDRTYQAHATVLTGAERDRIFDAAAAENPGWAKYQAGVARILPVVALSA